jgi:hypothetical protein
MTSDHRVAGSSPAGCKTNNTNYLQIIIRPKIAEFLTASCPNFALISQKNEIWRQSHPHQPNAAAFERYADLVGVAPQEFQLDTGKERVLKKAPNRSRLR